MKRSGEHQREFFSFLFRYKLRFLLPRLNLLVKHMNSLQCILIHYENNPMKLSSVSGLRASNASALAYRF